MSQPDVLAQQLALDATNNLTPTQTRVFLDLPWSPAAKAGELIARSVWPEREWIRSRSQFQLIIHQLRKVFSEESIQRTEQGYSIDRQALETALLRRQFGASFHEPATELSMDRALDHAAFSGDLEELVLFGARCADLLLDGRSEKKLWDAVRDPEGCPVRIYLPAGSWRRGVSLVRQVVEESGLPAADALNKCVWSLSVFLTIPMQAEAVQLRRGRLGRSSSAAVFSPEGWCAADWGLIDRFVRELESRRQYAEERQAEAGVIQCDLKDAEAVDCRARISSYYRDLDKDFSDAAPLVAKI